MESVITIVSVGDGTPDLLNEKTINSIRNAGRLILRTSRHPIVSWLNSNSIPYSSLDYLYEEAEDFDDLSGRVAACLISYAESSSVVYAVADALTDSTVKMLYSRCGGNTDIRIIPGTGTFNISLSSVLPYFSGSSFFVMPASELLDMGLYDPNRTLLITELDNLLLAGQVKLFLSEMLDDEYEIYLIHAYSNPVKIRLYELDRSSSLDHRSSVLIPSSGFMSRSRFVMPDLISIMNRLLSPEGCPWDRSQTHESLRPYLIEEAWECIASIDQNDTEHLSEELGDLLFQIVFHASIGQSFDEFTWNDIVSSICLKMIRRHPHVFSDLSLNSTDEIRSAWEQIKQDETGRTNALECLDDVSSALPSLKYASQALKKIRRLNAFKRNPDAVFDDIEKVISRLKNHQDIHRNQPDLGRMLLLCTELCSCYETDSEYILHATVERLIRHLRNMEKELLNHGKSLEHLTFDELGVYLKYVEGEIE